MQAFYFIVEPNLFHYEYYKVYAETVMESREKLAAWLKAERPYYPGAPGNMHQERYPHLTNKNSRPGWRYLVK